MQNDINADLDAMKETLTKVDKEVSIALKENELQDEKMKQLDLKHSNLSLQLRRKIMNLNNKWIWIG